MSLRVNIALICFIPPMEKGFPPVNLKRPTVESKMICDEIERFFLGYVDCFFFMGVRTIAISTRGLKRKVPIFPGFFILF